MAQVVLDQPQVVTLVSQHEPTGMPQRMRMHTGLAGALCCRANEVINCLAGKRLATFGDESSVRQHPSRML
jgi:hypothetical protein